MNVVSVDSGNVHIADETVSHPFPKYSTPKMALMKFRFTDAPVTCMTCVTKEGVSTMPPAAKKTTAAAKKTAAKKTETAPSDATNAADTDELISAVHATIDQIKAVAPGPGAHGEAGELKREAEEKIRQLPTAKRNTLRAALNEAFKAVTEPTAEPGKDVEPAKPARVIEAEDPRSYKGVPKLITDGVKAFNEGLDLGIKLGNVGERLARIILDMRLAIPNPDAGNLPDLTAERKTTKNGAGAIYDEVRKSIAEDDVERLNAHGSMVRASQNKASDVLVDWLHSFDTTERAQSVQVATDLFPGVDKFLKDDDTKVSEAIRALYASHEITLPRYGRTELARIDRRVKALGAATKELEALDGDDAKAEELKGKISDLKAEIPEEFLEPTAEKTDAQKAAEALDAVKAAVEKAGKRAKAVKTAAQKRKVKAEAYEIIRAFVKELDLDLSALIPADEEA
ncbi:immunity repressor [Streptomyces phage Lilbooboo]|uniref:Uncharacterized protein n=1 Tax=Streptomyces phage Lilbooboo TaxID=2510571 RepID=A0A411B2Z5_9CAUD|nr:immunity repressor [Streptomyces phage Lilbooboo]QAX94723.1 hypothetical protein SEA_LILBOOBOO_23 [Streptomyces phage Lilbooboo]